MHFFKYTAAFGIVTCSSCRAFTRSPLVNIKLAHAKVHSEWRWRNENMILHLNFQHAGLPCRSYLIHSVQSIVSHSKKKRDTNHRAPTKETLKTSDSRWVNEPDRTEVDVITCVLGLTVSRDIFSTTPKPSLPPPYHFHCVCNVFVNQAFSTEPRPKSKVKIEFKWMDLM